MEKSDFYLSIPTAHIESTLAPSQRILDLGPIFEQEELNKEDSKVVAAVADRGQNKRRSR
jgi:hypothetical protein